MVRVRRIIRLKTRPVVANHTAIADAPGASTYDTQILPANINRRFGHAAGAAWYTKRKTA
jgi:hypothetical protein